MAIRACVCARRDECRGAALAFGVVGHSVLTGWCDGDAGRLASISGRFADQVWPGDTIVTRIWDDGDVAVVEARTQRDNIVISSGRATRR